MSCTAERWERTSRRRLNSYAPLRSAFLAALGKQFDQAGGFIKNKASRYAAHPHLRRLADQPDLFLLTETADPIQAGWASKIVDCRSNRSAPENPLFRRRFPHHHSRFDTGI